MLSARDFKQVASDAMRSGLYGRMYAKHIQNWFLHFASSQFLIIPFQLLTGRPGAASPANRALELLGVKGKALKEVKHSNKKAHTPQHDELSSATIAKLRR